MERPSDAVRERLLGWTLDYFANRSPSYARRLAPFRKQVTSLEDLVNLPVLTKAELISAGSSVAAQGVTPLHLNTRSGTSGGPPLFYTICAEELATTAHLVRNTRPISHPQSQGLLLNIQSPNHGPTVPMYGDLSTILFHNGSAAALNAVPIILQTNHEYDGRARRIDRILTTVNIVKRLTAYLLAKGWNLDQFGLREIVVVGSYLSRHFSSWLERTWHAN